MHRFIRESRKVAQRLLDRYDSHELSQLEVLVAVKAYLSACGYNPTTPDLAEFFEVKLSKMRYYLSGLARTGLVIMREADVGHVNIVVLTGRGLVVLGELTGKM